MTCHPWAGCEQCNEARLQVIRQKARRAWRVFGVLLFLTFVWTVSLRSQQAVLYVAQFQPSQRLEAMYHEVEKCVGEKGDFKKVSWYITAKPWTSARGPTWGLWRVDKKGHAYIIAVLADSAILRHEIVHDILYRNSFRPQRVAADSIGTDPEHPEPPFGVCARRDFDVDYPAGQ